MASKATAKPTIHTPHTQATEFLVRPNWSKSSKCFTISELEAIYLASRREQVHEALDILDDRLKPEYVHRFTRSQLKSVIQLLYKLLHDTDQKDQELVQLEKLLDQLSQSTRHSLRKETRDKIHHYITVLKQLLPLNGSGTSDEDDRSLCQLDASDEIVIPQCFSAASVNRIKSDEEALVDKLDKQMKKLLLQGDQADEKAKAFASLLGPDGCLDRIKVDAMVSCGGTYISSSEIGQTVTVESKLNTAAFLKACKKLEQLRGIDLEKVIKHTKITGDQQGTYQEEACVHTGCELRH